jgi:DNA-binding NtrC family response regulator
MKSKAAILLIDDDVEFLRALNFTLTTDGYTVAAASNPGAAMDYVVKQRQRFDVLITDVQMLGIDGLRVLQIVKEAFPGIPVIVVSAFGRPDIREQATALGAFAFLDKPFAKQQIVALIEQATQPARKETQPWLNSNPSSS